MDIESEVIGIYIRKPFNLHEEVWFFEIEKQRVVLNMGLMVWVILICLIFIIIFEHYGFLSLLFLSIFQETHL